MLSFKVIITKVILFHVMGEIVGFNVDTNFPIIYSFRDIRKAQGMSVGEEDTSYFGYSVSLYSTHHPNSSRLLIGVPRGNHTQLFWGKYAKEPGLVFFCTISGSCIEKGFVSPLAKEYHIELGLNNWSLNIKQNYAWFGATIAIQKSTGNFTICAPRVTIALMDSLKKEYYSMHGMCYSGSIPDDTLIFEEQHVKEYNFSSRVWYNLLHGFSAHYARVPVDKQLLNKIQNRIIGEPMHQFIGTVSIHSSKEKPLTVEQPVYDYMGHFGYSVTSGHYFGNTLLYAASAPAWHYVGQILIINPSRTTAPIVTEVQGSYLGEYFGASLTTGDLNGDTFDDLIIGAPYWGEDQGKVYIYWGNSNEKFFTFGILEGRVKDGHFGYAVTCGDLNADGLADFVVGAPWEEDGVIYVYNGARNLEDVDSIQLSQRIPAAVASRFSSHKMKAFGFSLSEPTDIDGNGYVDLAVGAYKSGHAVVLRSRPVTKTQLFMTVIPDTLKRDAKQFSIELYPEYLAGDGVPGDQGTKITIEIDKLLKRTVETFMQVNSTYSSGTRVRLSVKISEHIQDYITPISILARHEFTYENTLDFCKNCPIEDKNNALRTAEVMVPFDIECGEDKICNANISIFTAFHGVLGNDVWIIGSNDVTFEANITNHGEPSYLTIANFTFPEEVMLRSILPFCQEHTGTDDLAVICDVGNPLLENEQKTIRLDLDMKHLIHSSPRKTLNFTITVNSYSANQGTTMVTRTLDLISEASLSLTGKTVEDSDDLLLTSNETPNITFRQSYQIYKRGATPISEARLILKVPGNTRDSNPLVYLQKPQLLVLGKYYECSSDDAAFLQDQEDETEKELLPNGVDSNQFFPNETEVHAFAKREVKIFEEKLAADINYLNCSVDTLNCSTIICDLSAIKTTSDVGNLVMKFTLNLKGLKDNFDLNEAIVKFSTTAYASIVKPENAIPVNGSRDTMEVVTTFYNKPKMQKIQFWIILVSVSIGLLVLLIFIAILSKLGFFKRKAKQDLAALLDKEMTQNSSNIDVPSTLEMGDT